MLSKPLLCQPRFLSEELLNFLISYISFVISQIYAKFFLVWTHVWILYFVLFSKVRSLWTSVNETLMVLEKEREVVSSLFSFVNQYALDGASISVNIPRLLLDRLEEQICQVGFAVKETC